MAAEAESPDITFSGKREFDVVIYGATGYSGELVVREMSKVLGDTAVAPKGAECVRWGIAGRSPASLANLDTMLRRCKGRGFHPPDACIVADSSSPGSLRDMTDATTVLINCAGPYALCGEAIVAACIDTKTHYVDITGEPGFLAESIWPRHQMASEKGIYLLPCCGFDCVPSEVGLFRVLEARSRALFRSIHSPTSLIPVTPVHASPTQGEIAPCIVDCYVKYGGTLSLGTFETMLNSIATAGKKLAKTTTAAAAASPVLPKLPRVPQSSCKWSRQGGWLMPLASADPQLIARAFSVAASAGSKFGPLSTLAGYRHWLRLPHIFSWLKRLLLMSIFFTLAKTKLGAKFLRWWRGGKKNTGPTAEERRGQSALLTLCTTEVDPTLLELKPFKAHVKTSHVYDCTASAAVLGALCLLQFLHQKDTKTSKTHWAEADAEATSAFSHPQGEPATPGTPTLPGGGAWTVASLFSKLPHTSKGVGLVPSLLDDFQARMAYHGAMNIEVEEPF